MKTSKVKWLKWLKGESMVMIEKEKIVSFNREGIWLSFTANKEQKKKYVESLKKFKTYLPCTTKEANQFIQEIIDNQQQIIK